MCRFIIKDCRTSSTIYLCVHEQMQIPDKLGIIIYLLLHFKHMLSDLIINNKSYFRQEKGHFDTAFAWNVFPLDTCRAYSDYPDLGNADEINSRIM